MGKTKKKWSCILSKAFFILMIISVDSMYILPFLFSDFPMNWLIEIIIPILYVLSLIGIFFIKKESNGDYSLIKMAMIGKILLIPWFGVNAFWIMILFLSGIVLPLNWLGLPVILVIDGLILAITSLYSSVGIYSFYRKHQMSYRTLLIVLQWIFIVDVVSSIVAFIQSNKRVKHQKE